FLMADYNQAAQIPIGSTFQKLEQIEKLLAQAFYRVFLNNLWKWMIAYDYQSALHHAEMWIDGLDEEEIKESFYANVAKTPPPCLRGASRLSLTRAARILARSESQLPPGWAKRLVTLTLELDQHGKDHVHLCPQELREQVPAIEDFLNDADGCVPGCVIP